MLKLIALRNTAIKVAICTVAALALNFVIYNVPVQYTVTALGIGAILYLIKCFYDMEVSRLESLEELNKISKNG